MKHLLLSLGISLLGLPAYAQFTQTFTGALALTDPTIPGDRLFRDALPSACGTNKAYPGVGAGATGVHYDTYTIRNANTTTTSCVTVSLTSACSESTINALIFGSAYTNSFVPTNLATNYKGDMGSSPVGAATTTMGISLTPGQTVVLVVSGVTATSTCSSYTLAVNSTTVLPVSKNIEAKVALAAYPNPVQDVLHIEAAKSGTYTLYSATGKAVKKLTEGDVSLADLPSGVYMLQQNETQVMKRIVKL